VARLGIFHGNAPSLVVVVAVAVGSVVAHGDRWSATTATRRATCPESVLKAVVEEAAAEEVAATVTTAVNRAIFLVTAPSQDKVEVVVAAVETATTAANPVIFPGIAPSRGRVVVAVAAAAAADAIACNATVARGTATFLVIAPSEFRLEFYQASLKSAIKGSTFIWTF